MLAAAMPSAAQAPASPRSLELARRYVAALDMDKTMDAMMKGMLPAMIDGMVKRHPNMSREQQQIVMETAAESTAAMMPKILDAYVPVMADVFTEQELEALVVFYESPTGRSITGKLPKMGPAMGKIMSDIMPQMQSDMLERLCSKIDCKALQTTNPPTGS
ncbi:DUF2059 domain-containing protein [Caulobacter segnis]|uniref:DUF2059 domain-containing protein n=1 Tax=Caulobacter segnis TaxID=88688 RepID=UPI0024101784|nr:DUF2059 domain-containing protein [Caulobacter segnis]MDG2522367.1 DUF2059 domain-containing protein [Caulobacter segnis]